MTRSSLFVNPKLLTVKLPDNHWHTVNLANDDTSLTSKHTTVLPTTVLVSGAKSSFDRPAVSELSGISC